MALPPFEKPQSESHFPFWLPIQTWCRNWFFFNYFFQIWQFFDAFLFLITFCHLETKKNPRGPKQRIFAKTMIPTHRISRKDFLELPYLDNAKKIAGFLNSSSFFLWIMKYFQTVIDSMQSKCQRNTYLWNHLLLKLQFRRCSTPNSRIHIIVSITIVKQ